MNNPDKAEFEEARAHSDLLDRSLGGRGIGAGEDA